MLGSIAWPEGKLPGFAILSGQNLTDPDHKIWIFEEQEFLTVDNWLQSDGNLRENKVNGKIIGHWYGLSHFLVNMYAQYGAVSYCYGGQHPDVNHRHIVNFYKSKVIPKSVQLIEVPFVKETGASVVSEYIKLDMAVADRNTKLFQLMSTPDTDENNGKQAIKALFCGYEHVPWIDIRREVQPKIEFVR